MADLTYDEALKNLETGGLAGSDLAMAKDSLANSYKTPAPAPAQPQTAAPAQAPAESSTYVPRYTAPVADTPQPKSVEQVQQDMTQAAQGQINSLRDYENSLLKEQATVNEKNDRSTAAISTLTGLAGSTEADQAQQKTTAAGEQANKAIHNEVEMKVQAILGAIPEKAVAEARAQREEAQLAESDRIKLRADRQQQASSELAQLAASGVTFDGLKSDPTAYDYYVKQFGGEDALRGAFVLNTPQDQILDKRVEGGKYIVAKQNPITGKVSVETLDLGLPPQYTKTIDAGNRILAVPDNWDGDPAKLISINKGLTPSQAAAGGGGGGAGGGTYGSDLDAVIGATLSTIPTKFGQATFQSQISKARDDADKINLVAAQVLKGQPSEVKNDFRNQATGISEIDKAINLIDQGTQSGALEAGAQYTFNLAGRDFDPKLTALNSHIVAAIQPYRNSVTGAAWGNQEDQEYQQLFGSTKYSPSELRQRLVTTKEMLKAKSANALNTFVNPLGYYDNPFASGDLAPTDGDVQTRAEAAGYDYEAMKRDGLSDEEISASLP